MDLRGKVALVTGSATGIGRATALALARRGCQVVVNYTRSEDEANETVRDVEALGVRALLHRCDVVYDAAVHGMVTRASARSAGSTCLSTPRARRTSRRPTIWRRSRRRSGTASST